MYKNLKLLGLIVVTLQIIPATYGCEGYNGKRLFQEAEAYTSKVWSRAIPQSEIRSSLNFVHKPDKVDPKYGESERFRELLQTSQSSMNDQKFSQFAKDCGIIFDSSDCSPNMRIALHLLFESVFEKYSKVLKQFEKTEARKREDEALEAAGGPKKPNAELREMLANADKGVDIERFKVLVDEQKVQ